MQPRIPLGFLGIGAQRCGTTWTAQHLSAHPGARVAPGKELHFWNRGGRDLAGYSRALGPADGVLAGEITPAYALLDVQVVRRVRAVAPAVRLFYIVRDPRERAWSAAVRAVRRAEMTLDEASDAWFHDHFRSAGSRARGDYTTAVDTWLSVFDAEQLAVLGFADLRDRPRDFLTGLAHHLGLDPAGFPEPGPWRSDTPPLPDRHRAYLDTLYAADLARMRAHPMLARYASS